MEKLITLKLSYVLFTCNEMRVKSKESLPGTLLIVLQFSPPPSMIRLTGLRHFVRITENLGYKKSGLQKIRIAKN